jgi:hypothetical protein
MHNGTPRDTQLTRRRLLQLTGASATAVAAADLTGPGLATGHQVFQTELAHRLQHREADCAARSCRKAGQQRKR